MTNIHAGRPTLFLTAALLVCTLSAAESAQSTSQAPSTAPVKAAPSEAKKAFDKLKAMSGSWQGSIMGIPISGTIRAVSSGTAVLHEMTAGGGNPVPQQEITMFYVEEDRLFGIHYCDGGNRVRWEGKASADGKSIAFTMLDVAGGTRGGLLKSIAFNSIDADSHFLQGTFVMPDGKPVELSGEFKRK